MKAGEGGGLGGKVEDQLAVLPGARIVVHMVGGHDAARQGGDRAAEPFDLEVGASLQPDHDLVVVVGVVLDGGIEGDLADGARHGGPRASASGCQSSAKGGERSFHVALTLPELEVAGQVVAKGLELRLAGGIQQRPAAAGSPMAAVLVHQALGAAADVVQGLVVADGVADDGIPLGLSDLAGQGAIDQREQLGGLGAIAGVPESSSRAVMPPKISRQTAKTRRKRAMG